jgi:hypothetical protein
MSFETDKEGYPTIEVLGMIKDWSSDYKSLMYFIEDYFKEYGNCWNTTEKTWEFATGGWSGCEDIISSMQDNVIFWSLCWQESKRGGYYKFYIDVDL